MLLWRIKCRQHSLLDISLTPSKQENTSSAKVIELKKLKPSQKVILQSKKVKTSASNKMSLIPILFRDSFMDDFLRPSILEKSFFEDEFPSNLFLVRAPNSRGLKRRCPCASENLENKPIQKKSKEHFEVSIDVQNFKPEEISVKMVDNIITVEGKHEEKQDEHGFVSRHFVRKYRLPEGHDLEKVVSSLSSDGVLTVKTPRLALPETPVKERTISVVREAEIANGKSNGEAKVENKLESPKAG